MQRGHQALDDSQCGEKKGARAAGWIEDGDRFEPSRQRIAVAKTPPRLSPVSESASFFLPVRAIMPPLDAIVAV